jgi:hypothetical protein
MTATTLFRILYHSICHLKRIKIYQTSTLPTVLYWCETWYLKLKEEHRWKVPENSLRRIIFGQE